MIPVIKRLSQTTDAVICADTNKTSTARAALDAGAHMINNIKGTPAARSLLKTIARYEAGIVLMHIGSGTPRTMQQRIHYHDIIRDIFCSLRESIEKCLENGIKSDRIIIDPGIGFGKTTEHNLVILNRLYEFSKLGMPVLLGTSRKSFIGQTLNRDVQHRLMGSAATVSIAIQQGAHIVRVHDVKAIADTTKMTDAILNEKVV